MNKGSNYARKMFDILRVEKEEMAQNNLKKGSLVMMNDYVNRLLQDQDPDEGVEEPYKQKHD